MVHAAVASQREHQDASNDDVKLRSADGLSASAAPRAVAAQDDVIELKGYQAQQAPPMVPLPAAPQGVVHANISPSMQDVQHSMASQPLMQNAQLMPRDVADFLSRYDPIQEARRPRPALAWNATSIPGAEAFPILERLKKDEQFQAAFRDQEGNKMIPKFDPKEELVEFFRKLDYLGMARMWPPNYYLSALMMACQNDAKAARVAANLFVQQRDWSSSKLAFTELMHGQASALRPQRAVAEFAPKEGTTILDAIRQYQLLVELIKHQDPEYVLTEFFISKLDKDSKDWIDRFSVSTYRNGDSGKLNLNDLLIIMQNRDYSASEPFVIKDWNSPKRHKSTDEKPKTRDLFCSRCGTTHAFGVHTKEGVTNHKRRHDGASTAAEPVTEKKIVVQKAPFVPYASRYCNNCHKTGHITSECRGSSFRPDNRPPHRPDNRTPNGDRNNNNTQPVTSSSSSSANISRVTSTQSSEANAPLREAVTINGFEAVALLDCGADTTLIDKTFCDTHDIGYEPTNVVIHGADARMQPTPAVGWSLLTISRSGDYTTEVKAIVGHIKDANILIGMDSMSSLGIAITVIRRPCAKKVQSLPTSVDDVDHTSSENVPHKDYDTIFAATKDLLDANTALPENGFCTHPEAVIDIELKDDTAVYMKPFRIADTHKPAFRKQVEEWLETERISPTVGPSRWNFPATIVPKPDGGIRVCLDLRKLNEKLDNVSFPIPRIDDILMEIAKRRIASQLDLSQAFLQIKLGKNRHVLTFTCDMDGGPQQFTFNAAIFGLVFMSAQFQQIMQTILRGIPRVHCYIDNVIVASDSVEEHIQDLRRVLQALNEVNLRLNAKKCIFGCTTSVLLGHKVSFQSVQADPAKVRDIFNWPPPNTCKELESFLGLFGYLRDGVPHASTVTAPLDEIKNKPDCEELMQTPEFAHHFYMAKLAMANAISRRPYNPDLPFILATDASLVGLGAALFQGHSLDGAAVVAVASQRLHRFERNYAVYKRELLAIVFGLKKFRHLLLGRHFTLCTDHRALQYLHTSKDLHPTLLNWLYIIAEFDFDITHIPGSVNVLADALSRRGPENSVAEELAVSTVATLRAARTSVVALPTLAHELHQHGHFGKRTLRFQLLIQHNRKDADVEEVINRVVEECEICQRFKRSNQLFHTLSTTIADGPWELLQIDLATSLPTSTSGNNYLLIVVDTFSRFVVLHALPDKSAASTAQALLKTIASYGLPESIQTDEGKEFHNALWRDIFAALHMQHREPSAYTSRQQGAVERNVQIVVDAVRMELDGANTSWDVVLPSVQFFVNNRFCAPIATTPFTVLFGRPAAPTEDKDDRSWNERSHELKEVLYPALKQRLQIVHQRQNETFAKRHLTQEKSLELGTEVVLLDPTRENKMAPQYVGNYTIGQKDNLGRYFLFDSDGNLHPGAVDITRLKPVRRPLVPADVTHRTYTIERILDLRGPPNAREYKVKWAHDRTPTWEPHSNFVDIKLLDDFEREWSARRRNNTNNQRPRRR